MDNCQASRCATLPLAEQDSFIFNDALHFTTAFDQILADSAATAVPEPSSAVLAIAGLLSLAMVRHRRPGG